MAPAIPTFHVSTLPSEINTLPNGKRRKPDALLRLSDCERKEMVQYKCVPDKEAKPGQKKNIECTEVTRFYRVCKDGMHIETTAWEAWNDKQRRIESEKSVERSVKEKSRWNFLG